METSGMKQLGKMESSRIVVFVNIWELISNKIFAIKHKTFPIKMAFQLPDLPYTESALEPFVSAETMFFHYEKHHKKYVEELNSAKKELEEYFEADLNNCDLIEVQRNAFYLSDKIRNNGGGHYNHSLFWRMMAPVGSSRSGPSGVLKRKIESKWGSLDDMKKEFNKAAEKRFGSGWAWLVVDSVGNLQITSTPNQDNPLMEMEPSIPILGLDVWEHAYYLQYQNRRPEYIQKWWNVVNWDTIVEFYDLYAQHGLAVPATVECSETFNVFL
jgi:Fe-Mn family superoxide dismutase